MTQLSATTNYSPMKTLSFVTMAILIAFGTVRDAKYFAAGVGLLLGTAATLLIFRELARRAPLGYEGKGGFYLMRPRRSRRVRTFGLLATLQSKRKRARWLTSPVKV